MGQLLAQLLRLHALWTMSVSIIMRAFSVFYSVSALDAHRPQHVLHCYPDAEAAKSLPVDSTLLVPGVPLLARSHMLAEKTTVGCYNTLAPIDFKRATI